MAESMYEPEEMRDQEKPEDDSETTKPEDLDKPSPEDQIPTQDLATEHEEDPTMIKDLPHSPMEEMKDDSHQIVAEESDQEAHLHDAGESLNSEEKAQSDYVPAVADSQQFDSEDGQKSMADSHPSLHEVHADVEHHFEGKPHEQEVHYDPASETTQLSVDSNDYNSTYQMDYGRSEDHHIHEPAVQSPEEPAPESEKPIDSTVEPMVQEVREENVDRAEDKSVEIEAPQEDSSDGGEEPAKDEEEMRSLGSTAEQSEHMEPPMPEEPKEPEPETEKPIDSSVKPMVHEVEEEHVARAEDKSVEIEAPTGFDQHDEQSGRSEEIQDQQKSYEVVERDSPVDSREDVQDYPQEEEEGKPGFGEKMGDFAKKAGLITGGIIAAPVGLAALGAKAAYDKLKKGDGEEGDDQEEFKRDYEEHSQRFEQPSNVTDKQDLPQEFVESEPYKQDEYSSVHESPLHKRDVDDVPKDEMRMVQEEAKDTLESRMSESMYEPEDLKKHESLVHEEESQEESDIHEKISLGESKDHLTTIPTQRMDDVEAEDYQRHPEDEQKADSIQEPQEHPEEPTHHEESLRTEEFSTTEPEYRAEHDFKTDEPLRHEEIMESTKIETHHVDYPDGLGEQMDSRMTESLYEPEDLKDHSDERAQESLETETISTTHPEYQQDEDASEHLPVHEEHPTEGIHEDHRDQDTEVTDNQFSETSPSEHLPEAMEEPLKHQEIIETTKIETHQVDYPDDQGEQLDSRRTESLYEPEDLKDHSDERADSEKPEESLETETFSTTHLEYQDSTVHQPSHEEMSENQEKYSEEYPDEKQERDQVPEKTATPTSDSKEQSQMTESMYEPEEYPGKVQEESKMMESVYEPEELKQVQEGIIGMEERSRESEQDPMTMSIYEQKDDQDSRMSESKEDSNEEMTKSVYEAEGLKDLDESSERTQNDDYSDLPQDAIDSRMTESMYGELKQEGGEDYVIPSDPYHEELMDAGEVPKDEMELIREGLKEEVGVAEDDLQKKAVENAAIEESYHQEEAGGYSDSSKHEEPETHHDQGEKMDSRMTESLYEDHSDERAGSEKPEESLATESISTTHPEYQQHEEPSEPQPLHKGMEEKKGEDHEPLTHQEIIESERIQTAHVDYPEPGSQKDRVDDLSSKMSESMYEPEEKLMKEQEPSSQPEAGDDGSSRMAESMYEPEEMRDQEKPEDDSETTKPEDLEKPSPEDQIPTQHVATEREEASPEDDEEEEEDFNEKDGLLASEAANDDKPTLSEKLGGFMKTAGKVTGGVLAAPVALAAVGAKSAYDAMKQGVDSSPEETTGLLKTPQDEDGERVYYSDESNEDEPQPLAEERDERQIIDDRMDEHHRDIDDDPTMMAAGNVHAEKIEEQHPDERETTQQIEADFAEESGFERIEPPQRDEEKEGFVIESEPYEREEDEERFVEEPAMRRKSEELREHLGSLRTQGEQVAGIVDAVIESQPYDPMEDEMTSAAGLQEAEKPAETEFSMQAEHVREISADSEHLDQDGTRPPLPHHPSEFADLPAYEQSRMEQPLPTSQESLAGSPEERAEEKAAEQVVAEVFDPLEQHLKEYKELGERALGNVARVKYGDDSDEEQPDDGWKVYDKQGELVQEFSTKLADDAIGEVLKSDDSKCLKKQESCQEISMEHEVDYYSDLQEKLKILEEQKGDGDFVRDDDEEAKLHVIHEEDDEATQQIAEELVEEVMTQVLGELNEPNSNYITPSTTMSKDYETCKDTASSFGTASTSMQDSQYSTAQSEQTPQLQSPMEAPAMARIHEDTARSTPDAQLKKLASVDSSASLLAPEMDANRPISPVPPRDAGESFVFVEDRSSPDSVVIREDIEPEMVFVREEEDGELVELPPVEEEEETSSSSGVAGNLAKYRHATSSDNLSLNSLQEFERLEKEIGTRGDGSLTKSELELLACARLSKSGDGSVSSLAEFERLEKELENQSPTEDVMMLSDIREESEAEDMSTRDDDEEEQLLESRPVQEERAQTPTAMLTEDMMITSVDSLEPHNFELVPNVMETSATDSLDPRTDQEDSLIGESERDRDSLDGSFPTTLTTFQTTAIAPDGSVQTISRSVETRMTDPIVSRVLFTGTESQERLDQLPDEQHFETVDSLGNVTKTTYRRQH